MGGAEKPLPPNQLRMMEDRDFAVEKIGPCVVVTMNLGENRLNSNFCRAMHKALDQAERYEDVTCLVTIGVGKCYSLGLDLDWIAIQPPEILKEFVDETQRILARLLTFPLVTVAALNGHTYAAGAFVAISHDYMIMRDKKGWFCFPEVRINRDFPVGYMKLAKNFPVGYVKLAKSRLPHAEHHQALVLGKRYTCEEALAAKVIQEVCPVEQLKERAMAAGKRLAGKDGLDRNVLSTIKRDLYRDTYKSLMEPLQVFSKL